jgi:hypothetical protein
VKRTIRLCLPCPDPRPGKIWGDWYFAQSLSRALTKQGCTVELATVRKRTKKLLHLVAPQRAPWRDEIDLVIRGKRPWRKLGKRPLFIWLISQADTLTDQEIISAEHVFVASKTYAKKLQEKGAAASHLPQCTDADLFRSDLFEPTLRSEVLFVGNWRAEFQRPVVNLALAAGCPLSVYGRKWEGKLPDGVLKGASISNDKLGAHYASASVVLNDHHPDMLRNGFVSNRLYDVLASGTPVMNEEMPGIPADLREFVFNYKPDTFPDQIDRALADHNKDRTAIANYVRAQHSFENRAQTIRAVL